MKDPLVDRLRKRLEAREWTRVHVCLLVGLSAGVAFLASVAMLALHVHSMAWRYGIAALAGYGTFLLLLHGWVAWKRSQFMPDTGLDLTDLPLPDDIPLPSLRGGGNVAARAFSGGRSGGAGASASFDSNTVSTVTSSTSKSGGGFSLDLDGDDLFWLIVALVAAFAGAAAVAYVIYIAPTLMAEAAVNAAVAGKVYHGLRRRESPHWTRDMLRRTGIPAGILVASVAVAGYALQRVAPEARSIGGVWYHLRG